MDPGQTRTICLTAWTDKRVKKERTEAGHHRKGGIAGDVCRTDALPSSTRGGVNVSLIALIDMGRGVGSQTQARRITLHFLSNPHIVRVIEQDRGALFASASLSPVGEG